MDDLNKMLVKITGEKKPLNSPPTKWKGRQKLLRAEPSERGFSPQTALVTLGSLV